MENTGKIGEYCDCVISLKIGNGTDEYQLTVGPTSKDNVLKVRWNKESYSATPQQAKAHIRTALNIAKVSTYKTPQYVNLSVPFYPTLSVPLEKIDTILPMVDEILDNYT
jgi:hypothetical protein